MKILLQAEVLGTKGAWETSAKGVVIESRLDKGRGSGDNSDSIGTLKQGDVLLAGRGFMERNYVP